MLNFGWVSPPHHTQLWRTPVPKVQGLAGPHRDHKLSRAQHRAGNFPCWGWRRGGCQAQLSCRKGTERATNHVSYTYRDFPAEISDSGEESDILGAQKDPGTPQP